MNCIIPLNDDSISFLFFDIKFEIEMNKSCKDFEFVLAKIFCVELFVVVVCVVVVDGVEVEDEEMEDAVYEKNIILKK